jgi:8-oxo-dGTP diphosphatase
MKTYVVGFMINEARTQVALIQKTKPEWQAGLLNGIGGKVERGEAKSAAMTREFLEETGVQTYQDEWSLFLLGHDYSKTYMVYFYRCIAHQRLLDSLTSPTEEKVTIVNLSDLDTLPIIPNLKWAIRMCLDKSVEIADVTFK